MFFWGWFLGYGPLMAIFIAQISKKRTIRELILTLCILSPLITCFWFTIVGGSGIYFEIQNLGVVSEALASNGGFNFSASLLAITLEFEYFPLILSVFFLILTSTFIITTGDSMTYVISSVISKDETPNKLLQDFFGGLMGSVAIILVYWGDGKIGVLQSFIVVASVSISVILLPSLWNAPKIAKEMAIKQGLKK